MSPPGADDGWPAVRSGLFGVLVGLKVGEVIEIGSGGRFYLQVGRVPDQILFHASGPPTPDLEVGQLDPVVGERLRSLGFQPSDDDTPSWQYVVDVPVDPVHLEFAAGIAVEALREAGAGQPAELVWTGIATGAETEGRAALLGIPRNPHQAG